MPRTQLMPPIAQDLIQTTTRALTSIGADVHDCLHFLQIALLEACSSPEKSPVITSTILTFQGSWGRARVPWGQCHRESGPA
jgi:hypothetical protein